MAAWKYIKGSEMDFLGAPEWATMVTDVGDALFFLEGRKYGNRGLMKGFVETFTIDVEKFPEHETVIAQRERVTSINDDRLAQEIKIGSGVEPGRHSSPVYDFVNHPKHYTQGGIECIDAIKAATIGKSGIEAVCVANVVKYLWRYEQKGGIESVKKARWYLERLISELESDE